MTLSLAAALACIAAAFLYPYLLHSAVVRLFSRRPLAAPPEGDLPTVSVLIPAHNEAEHIHRKLRNTLKLDYPNDHLEVIVCSDGSRDRTEEIVRGFDNVRLVRNDERSGKAFCINRLVREATGEALLLTDASAQLWPGTLRRLSTLLVHPDVGLAGSRYVVRSTAGEGETETGYWSAESRVRVLESERGMLVAASGAAYLVRRDAMPLLPTDTVNDDWVVPLSIRAAGKRVVQVPDAVATESPTRSPGGLYHRWVRIAFGNYQMLWRHRRQFLAGRLFWPLLRKLLRTTGPLWIIAWMVCVSVATWRSSAFDLVAAASWTGFVAAVLLLVAPERLLLGPLRFGRFAALAQLAYLRGFVRYVGGPREGLWRRDESNEVADLTRPPEIPRRVRVCKRAIDIVSSGAALLLLSPIMLVIGALVRRDSPGPALYRQRRLRPGPDGAAIEFEMLKFRSMGEDAEEDGPQMTRADDDRITPLGDFLRRHRLDELPQFINVFRGDMSLVGPRPERIEFVHDLEDRIPGFGDRVRVLRPGITGWAQVTCEYASIDGEDSTVQHAAKLEHDLTYLASLYRLRTYLPMELSIILRTFGVMWSGRGAR